MKVRYAQLVHILYTSQQVLSEYKVNASNDYLCFFIQSRPSSTFQGYRFPRQPDWKCIEMLNLDVDSIVVVRVYKNSTHVGYEQVSLLHIASTLNHVLLYINPLYTQFTLASVKGTSQRTVCLLKKEKQAFFGSFAPPPPGLLPSPIQFRCSNVCWSIRCSPPPSCVFLRQNQLCCAVHGEAEMLSHFRRWSRRAHLFARVLRHAQQCPNIYHRIFVCFSCLLHSTLG